MPGLVRIEARHLPGQRRGVWTEVLFVDDTQVIHDERLESRHAISRRPRDEGESAKHVAFDHIVQFSAGCVRTLRSQDMEVIPVL